MSNNITSINSSNFFKPTINEVLRYNHLDLLFPETIQKHDEYYDKLPEEQNWHPYDWGHRNADFFIESQALMASRKFPKPLF